jgi:hypothetical protein
VVVAARELSELTVLQELLLKLVTAVLGLAILLQLLLFIMLVAVAGVVLMLAHCCLTPVLVEQAAVVLAGLVRLEQEPTEL